MPEGEITSASDRQEAAATGPELFRPGVNCWRVARAERLAVIIDAQRHFSLLKQALERAEYSVMLIGWDFDARVRLEPDREDASEPDAVGAFLTHLADTRPHLHIHLLKWDLGVLFALRKGGTPLTVLRWLMHRRIHYRLDTKHPRLSTHHQKIVVIDDKLAFCGGIDITAERWDTRGHRDDNPHRVTPWGGDCDPWHDASIAVDGEAAKALGELARYRWATATGKKLAPPPPGDDTDIWPEDLPPDFRTIPVAIARTLPKYADRAEVREIERLYLDVIGQARSVIYMESQYFACRRIAEALAARLDEPEGPEIVVINPESADGWLEEVAMSTARTRLCRFLLKRPGHARFRIYYPVTPGGTPIYVHAKIMIVDDWFLRVGSSNLNNRSMGYDTECDVALTAESADERRRVVDIRDSLVAEHLNIPVGELRSAPEPSLIARIERFRAKGGLVPLDLPEQTDAEKDLADTELLDPEKPLRFRRNFGRWLRRSIKIR